jgi:hypothetical protein
MLELATAVELTGLGEESAEAMVVLCGLALLSEISIGLGGKC